MKKSFSIILTSIALAVAIAPARAQTLPAVPPTPEEVRTNLINASGASAVATFALNLLPGWDRTATNSFHSGELELEVAPLWKSATASGSTPYLSVGADYFFTRNFGLGGDLITLGNGSGASDLNSAHLFAIGRKDIGNVAGYLMFGGGRDVARSVYDAEIGAGFEYRYSTGVGVFVDTRYEHFFERTSEQDHDFLTRVGLSLNF